MTSELTDHSNNSAFSECFRVHFSGGIANWLARKRVRRSREETADDNSGSNNAIMTAMAAQPRQANEDSTYNHISNNTTDELMATKASTSRQRRHRQSYCLAMKAMIPPTSLRQPKPCSDNDTNGLIAHTPLLANQDMKTATRPLKSSQRQRPPATILMIVSPSPSAHRTTT
jgi:hypothetical protein